MTRYTRLGQSVGQIARDFGVSYATVYHRLRAAGALVPSHTWPKGVQPTTEFNGVKYTWCAKGYYRRTDGDRSLLHHDLWEAAHGPIPAGYDIHRRDGDLHHNTLDNLVCVTRSEGTRLHQPLHETPIRYCAHCGTPLVRRWQSRGKSGYGWETPAALAKRQYCGRACHYAHHIGKPRKWSARRERREWVADWT